MVELKDKVMFLIIEKRTLTDDLLKEYGVEEESKKYLVKKSDGIYTLADWKDLYNFCIKLAREDRDHYYIYHGLELCHQKFECHELLKLLYDSLEQKDYKLAFAYVKAYYYSDNKSFYNLFLYLLSLVYELPDYYYKFLKNLNIDDFLAHENVEEYTDIKTQRYMIRQIHFSEWRNAEKIIDNFKDTIYKRILIKLLKYAGDAYQEANIKILWFVFNKDFNGLKQHLNFMNYIGFSNKTIIILQKIVEDILTMEQTNQVPSSKNDVETIKAKNMSTTDELIAMGKYEEALKIKKAKEWSKKRVGVNIKLILLQEINDRIQRIKNPNYETPYVKYLEICRDDIEKYEIFDYVSPEDFFQKLYAIIKTDGIVPYIFNENKKRILIIEKCKSNEEKDYSTIAKAFFINYKNCHYDYAYILKELKHINLEFDLKDSEIFFAESAVEQMFSLLNEGNSIEAVCAMLGLDDEHKNVLYLVLAKELYCQKLENYGDECIKRVQKCKDKSNHVKMLLQETINNKKLYLNKFSDNQPMLLTRNFKVLFSKN